MSNDNLLSLMENLILLSAFFGGFSATFLAAILAIDPTSSKKIANWIIVASALAACCFVMCATSSIASVNGIKTAIANDQNAFNSITAVRLTSVLSMLVGVFALLTSIGLSGWLRSKHVGIATSVIALFAMIVVGIFA